MAINDIKDFFFGTSSEGLLTKHTKESTALPIELRSLGAFEGGKIQFFTNISRRKHFMYKCLKQKLFLIKLYIKKVSCKIFVALKITLSARAEVHTLCAYLPVLYKCICTVLTSIRLDTVDVHL